MNLINVNNLVKTYGTNLILNNIHFNLNSNDKIAIVGRNGAGKSTLMKILSGSEDYDQGNIFISPNIKIGYFSQDSLLTSNNTVLDEMKLVFEKQISLKNQLDALDPTSEATLNKYAQLLQTYEECGGYTYEYKIETMLNKFGFKNYYNHNINHLSGGERTRLALAKLLLSEPDVLMLDEPSNHLDIETVEFLESFLRAYKNALIIVSHDRYFINQTVNQIYELEFNQGYEYIGNYDAYVVQKAKVYETQKKQYDLQQKLIEKEQDFINRNLARASTTKRAQSRRKKLEKLAVLENPKIDDKNIKMDFTFNRNSGNIVLDIQELTIGYNKPFIKAINFIVKKADKVAILGPNGIGKSTLLKTINQEIPALEGKISYGAGLKIAYFDQNLSLLHTNKTVLDEIWDENRTMLEKDIRTVLGKFLFSNDDVYKIVNDLSGGEKVRLALAKLTLKKANLLILDEVTNHLDIMSREILESALINFTGTIVFVSHDRFFINKVATKIIELRDNEAIEYLGDYNYYLEKKQDIKIVKAVKSNNLENYEEQKKEKNASRRLAKQIKEIEKEIETLEKILQDLKAELEKPEVYSDYIRGQKVHDEIIKKKMKLDHKIHLWLELCNQNN